MKIEFKNLTLGFLESHHYWNEAFLLPSLVKVHHLGRKRRKK